MIAIRLYYSKPFTMPGRQAKTLSSADVDDLLVFASCTRNPPRNRVIVLLSAKAGLRAGEIANLTWDMVLGPTGQISGIIELRDMAAKRGSGRIVPIHPDLRIALIEWRKASLQSEYVAASERGGPMTPSSIVVWFNRAFKNIAQGLLITFGTKNVCHPRGSIGTQGRRLAARCSTVGGHRSIQTTQRYIDGDGDAQRKLVSLI
jgi:integrase